MDKQQYEAAIEDCRKVISMQNERITKIREEYIEANKPCEKDQRVKITRKSGRVTTGLAKDFGILHDKGVYVLAIKPDNESKQVYISEPYTNIEIL